MPPVLNSFSSSLILGITLYRNQSGVSNKLIAQAGYALTAVVAAVETIAALAFLALSMVVYPFSPTHFEYANKWLGSSAFSLGWAFTAFAFNLFVSRLVADEQSSRQILQSADYRIIPSGAKI